MPWSYRCRTMDDVLVLAARADAARVERAYAVLTERTVWCAAHRLSAELAGLGALVG